jgi:hypothetical protein
MKASTHSIRLNRFTLLLVLGAIVAGTAATVAVGSNGRPAVQAGDRIVDDYWRDPPPIVTPAGERIVDDYFRDATRVSAPQSTGSEFDWGDWAIGLLAGLGIASCVAGVLVLVSHRTPKSGVAAVG